MPGPIAPKPMHKPAPSSAIADPIDVVAGTFLNISTKATKRPYMAVVWVTACPSSMTFVNVPTESGFLAIPSQLVSAINPPPSPEPMAPSPAAKPAPRTAAQVGETARAEKSENSRIKDVTRAKMEGVWQTADPMSIFVVKDPLAAG